MAYQKIGNSPKTLVITSKHPILEQWKNLFSETLGIVNNIDYLCIQSAYKRLGEYDFIIIDEVHRALSPKHRAVFAGLKAKYMMCLTATLPEDEAYINFLGEKCPVIYAKHLLDVVKQGILPEFKIYNLEVELHKSLTGKYKVFNNSFTSALIHLEKLRSQSPLLQFKYRNIFELANTEQRGSDPILKKLSQQY